VDRGTCLSADVVRALAKCVPLRFLLDTNILIPLEDSTLPLGEQLARFVRLAHEHGHQLVFHPASEDDIARDRDEGRRHRTLERLRQYSRLDVGTACPWNTTGTSRNDAADNAILYALACDAAHALVTEDRDIHDKARARGLVDRVYTIQTADDFLRRLHEPTYIRLPSIEDVPLHQLTPLLSHEFFDSLREGYQQFDGWFREKARHGRRAWVYWELPEVLGAICVYDTQKNERVTDDGRQLYGMALKLCTFKVDAPSRGRKIGELFLKAAFRYATANRLEHIFIHGDSNRQHFLFKLLEEFGFESVGMYRGDAMYVKEHPSLPPAPQVAPFEYLRRYYPHYRADGLVSKYVVPIRPVYHEVLFPDYDAGQLTLFRPSNTAGNAIKLAYLCHAQTQGINPGDVVLFYRSTDQRAVTSIGVVEQYETLSDPSVIAARVSRRTVYSMNEITFLAQKPTKVMLFRLVRHLARSVPHDWLKAQRIVSGNIQSIREITELPVNE
jgi:hypothetical protein